MKRIISVILLFALFLTILPLSAASEESSAVEAAETEEDPASVGEIVSPEEETDPVEESDPTTPEADDETPEPPEEDDAEYHKGYIFPFPGGFFRPEDSLKRYELAEVFYTLFEYKAGKQTFSDVPDDAPYAAAVNALAKARVLKGYSDGTFRPEDPVTRAQLVTVLARLSKLSTDQSAVFSDVAPSHWAFPSISLSQQMGWVNGYEDGTFRPEREITRAEAVTVINRYLNRIPDKDTIKKAKKTLFYYPDVSRNSWYYYDVMEATVPHRTERADDDTEIWTTIDPIPDLPEDGFYCLQNQLYVLIDGVFVHTAGSCSFNDVSFVCEGANGICTADAETLFLADGKLLLLENGTPFGVPGSYKKGFYVMNGLLYAAKGGKLVHKAGSFTLYDYPYTCEGSSGVCQVDDWTSIPIRNTGLSLFSADVPGSPVCSFRDVSPARWYYKSIALMEYMGIMDGVGDGCFDPSGTVSHAQALKVAVEIYERYFRIRPGVHSGSWYRYYVNKALEYGILDEPLDDCLAPATRGDVAVYLYRSMRGRELNEINPVAAIPDVPASDEYYPYVYALYSAGILQGSDQDGNAHLDQDITRAELAAMLSRLLISRQRLHFSLTPLDEETIQYGTSGSGKYPLTAYRLGAGDNVMVLTFAIHGWEDHWNRDGKELVSLANKTKSYLEKNYSLITGGDWTVYVLPCLNPDGLYLGDTHNGPGRCTTTYYNSAGTLITSGSRGIDMNRCFPYNYSSITTARNYNGTAPLQCVEARALAAFMRSVKGSGKNVCIDTHGWFSQIITSSGKGTIYNAFLRQFPDNTYATLKGSGGYFTGWTAYSLGYDSCLFELPSSVKSHSDFVSLNCVGRFEAAIAEILTEYPGAEAQRGPVCQDDFIPDGN